ncbi:MAG: hypothetical protein N2256_04570 [Tepidimonas ignava]|uniref:Uncharacterized protein n=1 Tax=Tepidimonas ignava TaxID=114249 RepID=A0A4R3LDC1_9BURK|nr:hypothetical protein [Tepidimonas ignava]MCX7814746.1 hypothetical protein [Tepidimonas ignava]TCS97862.1 hypothetical protein EDC36_10769 [Tepidimonas ignava]TSE23724.1 hypothetical protein Tigna_00418 [Tepidimonas ignava]
MRIPATHPAHAAWPAPRASTTRTTAGDAAPSATDSPVATPTSATASGGPPGLQRVLQRLQALPTDTRTPGQQQALTRIERNLQRYLEHQGLADGTVRPAEQPALTTEVDPVAAPGPTPEPDEAQGDVALTPVTNGEPPLPTQALLEALPG